MGVPATQAPQFDLLKTVAGCSGLLDVDGDLALFSRSTSDDGAIAQCQLSAATTILRSERGEPKLDYAVCARVITNFVVVVRRKAIEFYSLDAIHRALKSPGQPTNGLDEVFPTQSVPFPGGEWELRATFLNRPLHCEDPPYHGTDAIYLGIDRDQQASQTIRVVCPDTSDGAEGCSFAVSRLFSVLAIMPFVEDSTVLCAWGGTGRRMVYVEDFQELCVGGFQELQILVTGFCTPTGLINERFVFGAPGREVFRWKIPDSGRDVARYLAFDEVTGVCAFAMGSGRIWIADPFCNGVGPKDQDVPLEKIQFWNSPHPDPAWRFIPRKPWFGEPSFSYGLRDSLLPPISTEVCRWFPGKNDPEAFGSVKWFVNEVLHIPGPATILLVGRLLLIDRDTEMPSYDIKLLDTNITLESVVAHIKAEGLLANLPGKTVAVDSFSLHGYDAWLALKGSRNKQRYALEVAMESRA
ncbi:hypothetical protein FRC01_008006 [Tulasnella sp. 417]|nr:hypothetical protein FRC01_008006 [Tulasnella sp. 417]